MVVFSKTIWPPKENGQIADVRQISEMGRDYTADRKSGQALSAVGLVVEMFTCWATSAVDQSQKMP
jgi:hypothetical protein